MPGVPVPEDPVPPGSPSLKVSLHPSHPCTLRYHREVCAREKLWAPPQFCLMARAS